MKNPVLKVVASVTALVFLLAAGHADAKKKKHKGPTSDDIVKTYSMDQIEEVSNYLLARVEADPLPKGAKIIACDPPITKVNAWLSGPVHSLTDEKRALEDEAYKKSPAAFAEKIRGCADRCTCNAYQLLFEDVGEGLKENPDHTKNLSAMKLEMRKAGKDQSLKCAKSLKWFCGSPFDKFLQRQ